MFAEYYCSVVVRQFPLQWSLVLLFCVCNVCIFICCVCCQEECFSINSRIDIDAISRLLCIYTIVQEAISQERMTYTKCSRNLTLKGLFWSSRSIVKKPLLFFPNIRYFFHWCHTDILAPKWVLCLPKSRDVVHWKHGSW